MTSKNPILMDDLTQKVLNYGGVKFTVYGSKTYQVLSLVNETSNKFVDIEISASHPYVDRKLSDKTLNAIVDESMQEAIRNNLDNLGNAKKEYPEILKQEITNTTDYIRVTFQPSIIPVLGAFESKQILVIIERGELIKPGTTFNLEINYSGIDMGPE